MYHLSIPNGREPREHVQELTKKKGSIAAADIEVGGFANKVPLLFPQKKELKLVFKIKILRKDSSYSFFSCPQSLYCPMSKGNSKFIHPISL